MKIPVTPSFNLHNKRAVVTGASRGIGFAGAAALAQAGAEVIMIARNKKNIKEAADRLKKNGLNAIAEQGDVMNQKQINRIIKKYASIDILLNNAGTNNPTPYTDVTEKNFDGIVDLNVRAAFFVAQVAAKQMIKQKKGGAIIHISSQMGHVGGIDRTVYCASKFAIEGLTRASAIELAKHNIRVNTICPTFIKTEMTKSTFSNPKRMKWLKEKIKLGRIGEVEDIMGAVVFLASDAAKMMTGTSIIIDGGWTAD